MAVSSSDVLVVFGVTGDLAHKQIFPALYAMVKRRELTVPVVGVAFPKWSRERIERRITDSIQRGGGIDDKAALKTLLARFTYVSGDYNDIGTFTAIKQAINKAKRPAHYLAIPPSMFEMVIENLSKSGLAKDGRVIVEKPFGRDLETARALNEELAQVFRERQIFRIDHYLGKETTQNILVLRLGNGIFEPLWNRRYVDHVQITVAESIGVENRGKLYEEAGVLRDIIQNHVLQLLCLVAMEPPVAFDPNAVRDEKVKVLRSIQPQSAEEILRDSARGQYGPGALDGQTVVGYRAEKDVNPMSLRETYAAWKVQIENWRWAGVPFYLRAGKRLAKRVTEIAIQFKTPPIALFRQVGVLRQEPNVLVLRIQPDEGIALKFGAKVPGPVTKIDPVTMDFRYREFFGASQPEAYERLLMDAIHGDSTLFARRDEVEAAWEHVTPLLDVWRDNPPLDHPNYEAGTWGPDASVALLARDGRRWRRP